MQNKIAIVTKKSALQLALEHKNKKIIALLKNKDEATQFYKKAHEANENAKTLLFHALKPLEKLAKIKFYDRANVKNLSNKTLVITLGGDGTFLWASRYIDKNIPIIGLNSDPETSVGFFTIGSKETFVALANRLEQVFKGQESLECQKLIRLQVNINGKIVSRRILNDLYYGAAHPAMLTKYFLTVDGIAEEQKSGGLWASTAAGSTGGNLSAGGTKLALESSKAQWVVREPMKRWQDCTELFSKTKGFFNSLTIKNKTRNALVAIDGTTNTKKVSLGDEIEISKSADFLLKVKSL